MKFLLAVAMLLLVPASNANAVSTRVVATVNDFAISAYQVKQRVKLLKVLKPNIGPGKKREKAALQDLIDDKLKAQEAQKLKVAIGIEQVQKLIQQTPGLQSLASRLISQGLSDRLVFQFIATRVSWSRIVASKYGEQTVTDSQVDARTKQFQDEIKRAAAGQAVTIYQLMPITLPVDRQATPELTNEVARSRMIEADRIARRFKSCRSARKAASGVFNVQIGKQIPADPSKMPKQMRQTLDKFGPGSAFVMGVAPDASSVQVMAFCGRKRIAPEVPDITREMVKQRLEDERYENLGKSYLRDLRRNAFIEYKDASLRM